MECLTQTAKTINLFGKYSLDDLGGMNLIKRHGHIAEVRLVVRPIQFLLIEGLPREAAHYQ